MSECVRARPGPAPHPRSSTVCPVRLESKPELRLLYLDANTTYSLLQRRVHLWLLERQVDFVLGRTVKQRSGAR